MARNPRLWAWACVLAVILPSGLALARAKPKAEKPASTPAPRTWAPPPEVSVTKLGDINGDGTVETAKTVADESADTLWKTVTILSGRKVLLTLEDLGGDTDDWYKPVGRQIAVWRGDWTSEGSKWDPHYYNLTWYAWDSGRGKYVPVREGFTKKAYDSDGAKAAMSRLAATPGDDVVVSKGASFAQDALEQARQKYGRKECRRISDLDWRLSETDAREFVVNYAGERKAAQLKGRIMVIYHRDGSTRIGRWAKDLTP